jgi:hypothetical protein
MGKANTNERRLSGHYAGDARVHYQYHCHSQSIGYVGERFRVTGRITDKYVRRGRSYVAYHLEVHAGDGRLICSYDDIALLRCRPEGETANGWASERRAERRRHADRRHPHLHLPRRRWYSAGLRTAGLCQVTGPRMGGIRDDNDYARGQGMKGAIIDGMTITNWCSSLLLKHFGLDYVANGDLRTKFINPPTQATW